MNRSRVLQMVTWLGTLMLVATACGSDTTRSDEPPTPDRSPSPAVTPVPLADASPSMSADPDSPEADSTGRTPAIPRATNRPRSPHPSTTRPTLTPVPLSNATEEPGLRSGVYSEHSKTRSGHALSALTTNSCLAGYARSQARALAAAGGGIEHQDLQPILSGCAMNMVGENVAAGQSSPAAVQTGWMKSKGHRDNILNGDFNRMGASAYRSADDRIYWVVVFGRSR